MTPISELVTWTLERIPERFPQLIPLICDVLVRYSSSSYLDVFPEQIDAGLRLFDAAAGYAWIPGGRLRKDAEICKEFEGET